MARLPDEWIHGLLDRLDIHDIVERYVPLKEKSGRYWACCPFHQEKTPSFAVMPQEKYFYCYGCHKSGNAITFVAEMEKLNFREACERLARDVGMELPSEAYSEQSKMRQKKRDRLNEMNREAARFFAAQLYEPAGKQALAYLMQRGLNRKDIRSNGLGFAPDDWHKTGDYLKSRGFTQKELLDGGLQKCKKENNYDMFRGRVMFPIMDRNGAVIGFGGRVMDGSEPKYLNSPDTVSFNKSKNLYHMNVLKGTRVPYLLLMEGYMDVIGAAHYGIMPTVATLGTALTADQARMLKRYQVPVYVCYDGDNAGINAAVRACGILKKAAVDARVIVLPNGQDPDEFLRANGAEAFSKALQDAMDPVLFQFWVLRRDKDLHSPKDKTEYAASAIKILREEKSAVLREQYARTLAEQTGFSVGAILRDVTGEGIADEPVQIRETRPASGASNAIAKIENYLTAYLMTSPDRIEQTLQRVDLSSFKDSRNRDILSTMLDMVKEGKSTAAADVLGAIEDEALRSYAGRLFARWDARRSEEENPDRSAQVAVVRLMLRANRDKINELNAKTGLTEEDRNEQLRLMRSEDALKRELVNASQER